MLTPLPVQTTYGRFMNVGQPGMPATASGWDMATRICEDLSLTTGIGFGVVVSQGTKHGDRSAVIGVASGGTVLGITASDHTLPTFVGGAGVDKYNDGDNMAVAHRGDIWVTVTGTVAAGGPVYFNSATGAIGPSGITNATILTGCQFLTAEPLAATNIMSAAVGTLAVVRIMTLGNI